LQWPLSHTPEPHVEGTLHGVPSGQVDVHETAPSGELESPTPVPSLLASPPLEPELVELPPELEPLPLLEPDASGPIPESLPELELRASGAEASAVSPAPLVETPQPVAITTRASVAVAVSFAIRNMSSSHLARAAQARTQYSPAPERHGGALAYGV
jgi:hypothetical protein